MRLTTLIPVSYTHLTQERRKERTKTVSKVAEEGRIAVRAGRRDAMDAMKKLERRSSSVISLFFSSFFMASMASRRTARTAIRPSSATLLTVLVSSLRRS